MTDRHPLAPARRPLPRLPRLPRLALAALSTMAALAALAALAPSPAQASGDGFVADLYVPEDGTGQPSAQLEAGRLGVVLDSWPRVRLYFAYRAIALGPEGLRRQPAPTGTIDAILQPGQRPGPDCDYQRLCSDEWKTAAAAVITDPRRNAVTGYRLGEGWDDYLNCPREAFASAARLLAVVKSRPDATPARVQAWVLAQDQVFSHCDLPDTMSPELRQRAADAIAKLPPLGTPAPLPESEPAWWRQMREYQIAAATFYAGKLPLASARFRRIGLTEGHPMRPWGEYLALRADLRGALRHAARRPGEAAPTTAAEDAETLARLQRQADAILREPRFALVHEFTRATMRRARAQLTPAAQLVALGQALSDPATSPKDQDRLGDWRLLANRLIEDGVDDRVAEPGTNERAWREASRLLDWARTLQRCAPPPLDGDEASTRSGAACGREAAHARERWKAARQARDEVAQRLWLVPLLMDAWEIDDDERRAALAVAPEAPEYLTVQAELARLERGEDELDASQAAIARGLAVLDRPGGDDVVARNVFLRERFRAARTLADAARDLPRQVVMRDWDASQERRAVTGVVRGIDPEGNAWLQRQAPADLLVVARAEGLAPGDRARILAAAWIRAALIDQPEVAEAAAAALGRERPSLRPATDRFLALQGPERRHAMLVAAVRHGLSAEFAPWQRVADNEGTPIAPDAMSEDATASMWCRFPGPSTAPGVASAAASTASPTASTPSAASAPAASPGAVADATAGWPWRGASGPSADRQLEGALPPAERDAQLARLHQVANATRVFGNETLAWAAKHPDDPEVPWLLHVTIQSTRGGCIGPEEHGLSRRAHALLHKRYGQSVWAGRSKYFY